MTSVQTGSLLILTLMTMAVDLRNVSARAMPPTQVHMMSMSDVSLVLRERTSVGISLVRREKILSYLTRILNAD